MSLFSETTSSLLHLNYPKQTFANNYYTAEVKPGVGVCLAAMKNGLMVQFFPWEEGSGCRYGHHAYAAFISDKATTTLAQNKELFTRWPFIIIEQEADNLLLVKCAIEEGLAKQEKWNEANQCNAAYPATGQVVG